MKNHNYKCSICAKSFYNENDLKSHLQIHHDERKHAKLNIITNLSKQKKITWRENISCVRNIPLTKITVKGFTCKRIREMFLTIENLLLIFTNRNQLVSLRELVKHYELKSKIYFNEDIFRALISVYPDAYKIKLMSKEYHVFMHGVRSPINPSELKSRYDILELLIDKIHEEKSWYIDLVELEAPKHIIYI